MVRAKQLVWQQIIPNITSSSDNSSFVSLEIEYRSWNLLFYVIVKVAFWMHLA